MKKEIKSIITNLQNILSGEPWYGRAVYEILDEVKEKNAFTKFSPGTHSPIELLYHIISWSGFTLASLQKDIKAAAEYEILNFRVTDPSVHNWAKGIREFKKINASIILMLENSNDDMLIKKVPNRDYDYKYLLNGLIQHHIYHAGQIVFCLKK